MPPLDPPDGCSPRAKNRSRSRPLRRKMPVRRERVSARCSKLPSETELVHEAAVAASQRNCCSLVPTLGASLSAERRGQLHKDAPYSRRLERRFSVISYQKTVETRSGNRQLAEAASRLANTQLTADSHQEFPRSLRYTLYVFLKVPQIKWSVYRSDLSHRPGSVLLTRLSFPSVHSHPNSSQLGWSSLLHFLSAATGKAADCSLAPSAGESE